MKGSCHRPIPPGLRRIVEVLSCVELRKKHGRPVSPQSTGHDPIGAHEEGRPATRAHRRITATDPQMTAGRGSLCCRGHRDLRIRRPPIERMELPADLSPHHRQSFRGDISRVKRVEQQFHTGLVAVSTELGDSVVVADQYAAANPSDGEHAFMITGRAVREIAGLARRIARAQALVVSIDDLSPIIDHIDRVVRPPTRGQLMAGADDDPDPELTSRHPHTRKAHPRNAPGGAPAVGDSIRAGRDTRSRSCRHPETETRVVPEVADWVGRMTGPLAK